MIEFVSYDGEYPNLCSGTLILRIDGKEVTFPQYSLISGGGCAFDDEGNDYIVEGWWGIEDWALDGYRERAEEILAVINDHIPHGCCGGCL